MNRKLALNDLDKIDISAISVHNNLLKSNVNALYIALNKDKKSSSFIIMTTQTSCNYGGKRNWFLCPDCGKRARILYKSKDSLSCRLCLKLIYRSQQIKPKYKFYSGLTQLGNRIFDTYINGIGIGKKKGLHWKTFEREFEKYKELELEYFKMIRENSTRV